MNDRTPRLLVPRAMASTLALMLGLGTVALADTAPGQYYEAPKLVKQGTSNTPPAGDGTVVVQVLVNPDATFKVQKIVSSTNHGDDQTAMEMANSAQYAPASNGGKKVQAFYTYTLKFVGVRATSSDAASGGALAQYDAQLRAANYSGAKSGLEAYLQAHPNDPQASTLLGVADTFLNDFTGAAAAFDKAGTVPAQYKAIEARAYAGAAEKSIAASDGAASVRAAQKANELSPGVPTLNLLGTAQLVAGDNAGAVRSFEGARTQAADDAKYSNKDKATINANLAGAYLGLDQPDKALALLPLVRQLDPANTNAETQAVNYYLVKAQALQKAGNNADAAAMYDKAAVVGPAHAGDMYAQEAAALAGTPKPDWKAVKAVADKALAATPNSALANYVAGVSLANGGNVKDAIPFFQKADAAAKAAGDKITADRAEEALAKLNGGK